MNLNTNFLKDEIQSIRGIFHKLFNIFNSQKNKNENFSEISSYLNRMTKKIPDKIGKDMEKGQVTFHWH